MSEYLTLRNGSIIKLLKCATLRALRSRPGADEIRSGVYDLSLSGFFVFAAIYHSDGSAASLQALYNRGLNKDTITLRLWNLYVVTFSRLLIIVSTDGGKFTVVRRRQNLKHASNAIHAAPMGLILGCIQSYKHAAPLALGLGDYNNGKHIPALCAVIRCSTTPGVVSSKISVVFFATTFVCPSGSVIALTRRGAHNQKYCSYRKCAASWHSNWSQVMTRRVERKFG